MAGGSPESSTGPADHSLTLILEPAGYICAGDTMRFFGDGSSEWVRVR